MTNIMDCSIHFVETVLGDVANEYNRKVYVVHLDPSGIQRGLSHLNRNPGDGRFDFFRQFKCQEGTDFH